MRLARLEVRALPGIDAPFSLSDLGDGVNLLIGPNASGKSSVVRALRALLYEEELKGEAVHLRAVFHDGGDRLTVTRLGDTVAWDRDGTAVPRPPLPEHHHLGAYLIRIEDLAGATTLDGRIATRIAHDLAGGFDLAAVRGGFTSATGQKERQVLEHAEGVLNTRRSERDGLSTRVATLQELRDEVLRSTAVADRAAAIDTASDLVEAVGDRRDLRARLGSEFPPDMDALGGHEAGALDALRERVAAADAAAHDARLATKRAEETLAASGVAHLDLSPADLAERRAAATRLHAAEARAARADELVIAADATLAGLLRDGRDDGGDPDLAPEQVAELARRSARRDAAAAAVRDIEGRMDDLRAEAEEVGDPDALQLPRRLLEAWLAAPEAEAVAAPARGWWWPLLVAAPLAGGAGWALARGDGPLVALLTVAALVVSALALRRGRPRPHPQGGKRASIRDDYVAAGAQPLDSWTVTAVRSRYAQLTERIVVLGAAGERQVRRERRLEALSGRLEEATLAAADADRAYRSAAAGAGIPADAFDVESAARLGLVRTLREARAERDRCRAARDAFADRVRRERTALVAFLAATPLALDEADAGAEAIQLRLGALEARLHDRDGARTALASARRALEDAETARCTAQDQERALFAACRLDVAADADGATRDAAAAKLRERVQRLDDWKRRTSDLQQLEGRIGGYRTKLDGAERLLALAEAADGAELQRLRDAALAAGARAKDLTERIVAIETEVGLARSERAVERARADAIAARDALERVRDDALTAAAGAFLVDRIRSQHHGSHRPAALTRAAAWFERFTHHGYTLAFVPGRERGERLQARDLRRDRALALDELSTGTRAQLLLAVRIAHALDVEGGRTSLPIFLDEALTTTDADRFARVAEALRTVAADDGRQIFYLSARRSDAALWRATLGEDAVRTTDLAEARRLAWGAPPDAYAVPEPSPVPDPSAMSADAFAAALGVPAVQPWAPDAVHPYHLLRDDPLLVARLATLRIASLGALDAVVADGTASTGWLAGEERRTILTRIAATRAWASLWCIGRGRPVTVEVLQRCVSDTFLAAVATLAEARDGDAGALLAALRDGGVARFGPQRIDQLEEALLDHGCLDERAPLGDGPRLAAMARAWHAAAPGAEGDDAARQARRLDRWLVAGVRRTGARDARAIVD